MEIGKVPNDVLKEIILDKIKYNRPEVLIRPKIGEDCCAIDFGEHVCVMSSDPITGAVNEIGRLAVHINCNDIASSGVEPLGLMVTILAPPETTKEDLASIMGQICETANFLNIDILGGHTEITAAVNRVVIMSTAVGKVLKEKLVTTSGARPGDSIILTKSAGIEGTAIIAHDKEEELMKCLSSEQLVRAKGFVNSISVIQEGRIAGEFGVASMHDVTEGGVLGALWEVAEASEVGVEIYRDKIPVERETLEICERFEIDPLRLISSGCMLITCSNGEELVKVLQAEGVKATIIGIVTSGAEKILVSDGTKVRIDPPGTDELYKVIG